MQFGIQKLKIFSSDGAIIHSTQNAEIGEINRHSYFWNLVAKTLGLHLDLVRDMGKRGKSGTVKVDNVAIYGKGNKIIFARRFDIKNIIPGKRNE